MDRTALIAAHQDAIAALETTPNDVWVAMDAFGKLLAPNGELVNDVFEAREYDDPMQIDGEFLAIYKLIAIHRRIDDLRIMIVESASEASSESPPPKPKPEQKKAKRRTLF